MPVLPYTPDESCAQAPYPQPACVAGCGDQGLAVVLGQQRDSGQGIWTRTLTGPVYVVTQWNKPSFQIQLLWHLSTLKVKFSELTGSWGKPSSPASSRVKILTFLCAYDGFLTEWVFIQTSKIILEYFSDWLWKVLIKIPAFIFKLLDEHNTNSLLFIWPSGARCQMA